MPTLETTATDVPTQVGTILPRTSDRERRRATRTSPRLDPGRYLAIDDGDDVVVIALGGGTLHLGRSVAADIMLEHLSVSRRHAIVVSRDGETVILDDRSLNGVLVNGERVREARLRHGDAIQLGDVTLRYLQMT